MAKRSRRIVWTVKTGDEQYSGSNNEYLLEGVSAADVEKKALKLACTAGADEKPNKPYIRSIELIGEIEG